MRDSEGEEVLVRTRKVVIACCVKMHFRCLWWWWWIELGVGRRRFWGRKLGTMELVVEGCLVQVKG